jgi:hypothetical protein
MRAAIQALHVRPDGEFLSVGQMLMTLNCFEDLLERFQIAYWMLPPTKIEIETEHRTYRPLSCIEFDTSREDERGKYLLLTVRTSLCRKYFSFANHSAQPEIRKLIMPPEGQYSGRRNHASFFALAGWLA